MKARLTPINRLPLIGNKESEYLINEKNKLKFNYFEPIIHK